MGDARGKAARRASVFREPHDLDTRDPFGGFIIKGMEFDYDFDNFPLTQGLIDNIRRNQGRITPIDVNNGSNYLMTDRLRNNAYGVYGNYQNFANSNDGSTWAMGESGRFTIDNDTPARTPEAGVSPVLNTLLHNATRSMARARARRTRASFKLLQTRNCFWWLDRVAAANEPAELGSETHRYFDLANKDLQAPPSALPDWMKWAEALWQGRW